MTKTSGAVQAPWDILLIGGASGTGKSRLSYPLARYFGVTVTEIDDLHAAVHSMTTAEQQTTLHHWDSSPEATSLSAEQILDLHRSVCRALEPAIRAVVANRVEARMPVVLEGDYLLPEGASGLIQTYSGKAKIQAVFLYETDEKQLVNNFISREPDEGEQAGRAHVSWLFGNWIKEECERLGLTALPSRPWMSVLERAIETVNA
jgi:2-phosphoglycerate kinase